MAAIQIVDLATSLPAADRQRDCRRLEGESSQPVIFTTENCTSTMDVAWRLTAEHRFPDWASVLATRQTGGRGQFGRTWHSPPGNLYGTVRIAQLGPGWSDLAPLLLAESMRVVLSDMNLAAAIKWPNDLLIRGKKVGGLLVEAKADMVMAGLGLNLELAPPPQALRHRLAPPAGCLREFGVQPAALDVWIAFVRGVRSLIRRSVLQGDPQRFVDGIAARLAYIGERVLLDAYEAAKRPAVFLGLDAGGAAIVRTSEGERIFRSGSMYSMM